MSDEPHGLLDTGAQAERTALAWQRTGLTLLGLGALTLHGHDSRLSLTSLVSGVLAVLTGVALAAVVAPLRYRAIVQAVVAERVAVARFMCPAVTVVALTVAALTAGSLIR